MSFRLLTGAVLCCLANASHGAEMRSIDVRHEDGRYHVVSEVWFDAGLDAMYEVFRDWDLSPQFSSAVVEAWDIAPDATGRAGFYIRNRGCILFFCKSLVRTGYVEEQPYVELRAIADPERSDFRLSNERWAFSEQDGGTVVVYNLHMRPGFWVPPAIGPFLIKRKLREDGSDALDRIEALARERAAGDLSGE